VLHLKVEADAVFLGVKVVPGASRTRYAGEWDGRAKIAVAAPPERGRANKALLAFLAKVFKRPKRELRIVEGLLAPFKTVRIGGVTPDEVRDALRAPRRT
jgi:hypothetical protein